MNHIIQISDCHIKNDADLKKLERILAKIAQLEECDALLVTGDICCNPSVDLYRAFAQTIIKATHISTICAIPGNHDDVDMMAQAFTNTPILIPKEVELAECQLLFVDSSYKPHSAEMALGSGRVHKQDLERVKNASHKKPTVLVIHHPIFEVGNTWFRTIGLENRCDLEDIVQSNHTISTVICGHGHAFITHQATNTTQIMAPSTAYGFDHQVAGYQTTEQVGFLSLQVTPDKVTATPIYL